MKKIQLSIVALLATTNLIMAGGDINPITPYEVEDISNIMIEPAPIPVPAPIPAPVPAPEPIPTPVPKAVVIPPVTASGSEGSTSGFYAGLGLVAARYDTNCDCGGTKSGTDKTAGAMAKIGYNINDYIGVEARGMITPIKDDGGKIQHYGVFLKPSYPATDSLNIYGLGGIAKTKTVGTLRETDVSGVALGGGLEYELENFDVFADYERLYYKKGSPDLDAVSIGVSYDF